MDGEGCIRWNNTPTVEITNKHYGVLTMLAGYWGGSVRNKGNDTYVWTLHSKRAVKFLKDVGKFTVVKLPQVFTLLLAAHERDRIKRDKYINHIKRLKRVYTN